MNYLVGNWKSNKTIPEAKEWLKKITNYQLPSTNLEIVIAAPFTVLSFLKTNSSFRLAAQNISPFPSGPYTGEISGEMIKGLVDYVVVGHSERRRHFGETNEMVAKKTKQALQFQITPIVCLDEPYLESQIKAINHQLIFAYEPLAAIGSGKPDTPQNANLVAERIKKMTEGAFVLYGGSVDAKNAKNFMVEKNIDGLLVGQASLNANEFAKIIQAV